MNLIYLNYTLNSNKSQDNCKQNVSFYVICQELDKSLFCITLPRIIEAFLLEKWVVIFFLC